MMLRVLPVLVALIAPLAAGAETAPVAMRTADAVKGWQGVGKLLLGQRGFCTGALIAPDKVLTAAHCLFDKETGARTPHTLITFQAGWRDGRAEAYRMNPMTPFSRRELLTRMGGGLGALGLA